VASVLGLLVVVRVEVEVVENDSVGRRQVDAEAAGFRRQDEDENAFVVVVLVDQDLSERSYVKTRDCVLRV
jgi:hypothetical protein